MFDNCTLFLFLGIAKQKRNISKNLTTIICLSLIRCCLGYKTNSCAKYCFSLLQRYKQHPINCAIEIKKKMKSRTKQSSSSAAITATTKTTAACDSSKHYPSISAAYWLPAPNPTPYLLPGKQKLSRRLSWNFVE